MKVKYKSLPLILVIISIIIAIGNGQKVLAQEGVNIAVEVEDGFFNIGNLSPGNSEQSTLTVKNVGNIDFSYKTKINYMAGSELLFNTIVLEVSDGEKVIFKGKLSELNSIEERFLRKTSKENLLFSFGLPEEAGNEYQGLSTKLELNVNAKGKIDDPDPVNPDNPGGGGGGSGPDDDPNKPENPENPFDPEKPKDPYNPDLPEEPIDKDDPGIPGYPDNPNTPFTPENPGKPEDPITPKNLTDSVTLPATATNIFNIIFTGSILLLVGGTLFLWKKKRKI